MKYFMQIYKSCYKILLVVNHVLDKQYISKFIVNHTKVTFFESTVPRTFLFFSAGLLSVHFPFSGKTNFEALLLDVR